MRKVIQYIPLTSMRFLKNHIYFDPDFPDELFLYHNGKMHLFFGAVDDQYLEYSESFDEDEIIDELTEISEDEITSYDIWDLIRASEYYSHTMNLDKFLPMTWYIKGFSILKVHKDGKTGILSDSGKIQNIKISNLERSEWAWIDFLDQSNDEWIKEALDSILDEE